MVALPAEVAPAMVLEVAPKAEVEGGGFFHFAEFSFFFFHKRQGQCMYERVRLIGKRVRIESE